MKEITINESQIKHALMTIISDLDTTLHMNLVFDGDGISHYDEVVEKFINIVEK